MSKVGKSFFGSLFASIFLALSAGNSFSQGIEASITVLGDTAKVKVSGRNPLAVSGGNLTSLSFLRSSIGAANLGTRISDLTLFDREGRSVPYERPSPSEFAASAYFSRWSYVVDIAPQVNMRAAAHVSWLTDSMGLLMLDDLLPQFSNSSRTTSAFLTVETPSGWSLQTSEKRSVDGRFAVANIEKAVIALGKELRETELNVGSSALRFSISGQWLFSDNEAMTAAEEIYKNNLRIFGAAPADNVQFVIAPFPREGAQIGSWEAETRGKSVIIVSADMPFKTQSLQRLREQLRHEIFHLWLPNGVNLTGNYDWFYEGFALYSALKSGVLLNQIRFEDFLDTIARAVNIDKEQKNRYSLIDGSLNRSNGAETQLYARGMLAAFLCDVILLQSSRGKASVDTLFRSIFDLHRPPAQFVEANPAILKVLLGYPVLKPVVDNAVNGTQSVDLQTQLEAAGIENRSNGGPTNLRVKANLSRTQKAILDKLGYNNWRKLSGKE
jgi:predicted metalloprotease with PDZ domain